MLPFGFREPVDFAGGLAGSPNALFRAVFPPLDLAHKIKAMNAPMISIAAATLPSIIRCS